MLLLQLSLDALSKTLKGCREQFVLEKLLKSVFSCLTMHAAMCYVHTCVNCLCYMSSRVADISNLEPNCAIASARTAWIKQSMCSRSRNTGLASIGKVPCWKLCQRARSSRGSGSKPGSALTSGQSQAGCLPPPGPVAILAESPLFFELLEILLGPIQSWAWK